MTVRDDGDRQDEQFRDAGRRQVRVVDEPHDLVASGGAGQQDQGQRPLTRGPAFRRERADSAWAGRRW